MHCFLPHFFLEKRLRRRLTDACKTLSITPFLLTAFAGNMGAQTNEWAARRQAEAGSSPFISRIIEYRPAPGQFINVQGIGTTPDAESIVGGMNGLVSLGGFGGYIIVTFDHTVWNDPENPFGVDFTVVGNAVANSSEPGTVSVMTDTNGNGLPDDTWYELQGSNHLLESTIRGYALTWHNPNSETAAAVNWTDNEGGSGTMNPVPMHTQPYYPATKNFPDYPQDEITLSATLIGLDIDSTNPQYIRIAALHYGYADNHPFTGSAPYLPDNPQTTDVIEGNGGDAFDIDWAIDHDGNPVHIDGIDFVRIATSVNKNAGWLGEISTEIRAIIDVAPDDVLSSPSLSPSHRVAAYPNPTVDVVHIDASGQPVTRIEIYNASGQLLHANMLAHPSASPLSVSLRDYPTGIYTLCIYQESQRTVKRIVKK